MILAIRGQVPLGWAGPPAALRTFMRALLIASFVAGCTVGGATESETDNDLPSPGAGGNGYCSCGARTEGCVGCDLASGTCLDVAGPPCYAGGAGTFAMEADGVPFETRDLAAGWSGVPGAALQIAATAGNEHTIVLDLVAEVGVYDCRTHNYVRVTYFNEGDTFWNTAVQSPRPACTITVTAVGATFDGTFDITVTAQGQNAHVLSGGTFSVTPQVLP